MAVDVAPVQSGAEGGARDARVVSSLCGVCSSGCGVDVIVEDGLIQRIRPRREHPKGIVCTRGTRASEVVHAPDRLLYPQRRVGPRGSGEFERISWDEAYDMIVRGLEEIRAAHGPEAVAIYTGRGNFEFGLNEQFSPEGAFLEFEDDELILSVHADHVDGAPSAGKYLGFVCGFVLSEQTYGELTPGIPVSQLH